MPNFDDLDLFLNDFAVDITLHLFSGDTDIQGFFFNSEILAEQLAKIDSITSPSGFYLDHNCMPIIGLNFGASKFYFLLVNVIITGSTAA